jgi:tol-pal system protein YbgF
MRSRFRTSLILVLALAGCATRADLERVRRDQQEMRALLADNQVALDKINRQLDSLQASPENRQASASLKALDRRVSQLESRLASEPANANVPEGAGAPLTTAPGAISTPVKHTEAAAIALRRDEARLQSGNVPDTYRAALQAYREGQVTKAIELFRQFLRSGTDPDLQDNAQYWIGEAYYSMQDYNRAIIELNEVLLKYPQGDQVAGALLALATAFADSGDKIDARLILQKLITDHPSTEEGNIGRQQLKALTD